VSKITFDPQGLENIRGKPHEANTPASWRKRGELLAEEALAEWPFIDWEISSRAADCFIIAGAQSKDSTNGR
jgi:hypothetical protein